MGGHLCNDWRITNQMNYLFRARLIKQHFLNPLTATMNTANSALPSSEMPRDYCSPAIVHWINTIGSATSVIVTSMHNLNGLSLMKATILRVSCAKDETSAFSRSAPPHRKEVTP